MPTILSVEDLHVHFATREGIAQVLRGISFSLEEGETLGLLGGSGSGKTVLTSALVGLVRNPGRIVGGRIVFCGKDLLGYTESQMRAIRGKDIAVIVSNPKSSLNPVLTIGQQMADVYRAHASVSLEEAMRQVIVALRAVGINDPERRVASYPHEMSGGMAKRVIIATALLHSPKLLIADEPTFGLDVTIQRQILDMMNELIMKNKMTTLIVTRDLAIVANYCQRVGVLYKGEIAEYASVTDFFRNPKHPYSVHLINSVHA